MKLRARVKSFRGTSTNYIGELVEGRAVPVQQLPNPTWLEISEENDAFLLLYINANGECFADTWHQTMQSAKREATLGFGIGPDDWVKS